MDKILTIAIPTYNRRDFLRSCLDRILSQVTSEVKVIVCDNASNNYDFVSFIEPYRKRGVEVYVNPINIGGDANIARLFELCVTKWLWVIGDDDVICDGAVQKVLNVITKLDNAIYVKFNSKYIGRVVGLSGFANAVKTRWSFGRSFFISECIHNIDETRSDIFYHYNYLSTKCAQTLRVLKHLELNPMSECVFYGDEVISNQCCDVPTWSNVEYTFNQLVIFDIFRCQKKILKSNVFKDIVTMCFTYISNSDLSIMEKIYYYFLFSYKQGFVNMIRYNSYDILRSMAILIMGNKVYNRVMSWHRS